MIIEAGIADAYGEGFEFEKEAIIKTQNKLTVYKAHPKYKSIHGTYTDVSHKQKNRKYIGFYVKKY